MSRPVTAQVGSRTRPETSTSGRRSRILALVGGQAAQRIDGVFAIVDGAASDVERAYKGLEKSFRPCSRTNLLPPGMEEDYIASLLATLGGETVSIALAIWFDWDVVVGCCGHNQVYVSLKEARSSGSDEFINVGKLRAEAGTEDRVRIARFTPSPQESIGLVSGAISQVVRGKEFQSVVSGRFSEAFTPQDAAESLAGLAASAGDQVSAVVVQFNALAFLSAPSRVSRHHVSRRKAGIGRLVIVSALAAAVISITAAIFIFKGTTGTNLSAARGSTAHHTTRVQPIAIRTTAPQGTLQHRPATAVSSHSRRPFAPTPGISLQSWKFPALANAPRGKVLIALYNPAKTSVVSEIRIIGRAGVEVRKVRVKGRGTVKLSLPSSQARDQHQGITVLYVQGQSPIVPLRVVVGEPSSTAST